MKALSSLKNDDGVRSWRAVADELNEGQDKDLTPGLLWKVAKGLCQSERVEVALGLRAETEPVPVCPECGEVHERLNTCADKLEKQRSKKTYLVTFRFEDEAKAIALRRLFDAHGANRREIAEKLLSGELVLREP
jgi:hypothetical protein